MSDDLVLNVDEVQAELDQNEQEQRDKIDEPKEIRKENEMLENQMAANNSMNTGDDFEKFLADDFEIKCSSTSEEIEEQNKFIKAQIINKDTEEKPVILLLGGCDKVNVSDSLIVAINNEIGWKKLITKLPYAVASHGAQFLNNNLYIFGGYNSEGHRLNSTYRLSKMSNLENKKNKYQSFLEPPSRFSFLREIAEEMFFMDRNPLWCSSTSTQEWIKMADMNEKRSFISNSNVILNDQIWVLGGGNEQRLLNSLCYGPIALKSVEVYDPITNTWKYMKEMNECRRKAAAAVVNGKIFCCGGNNGSKSVNSSECYDPSSDIWTPIANMPFLRSEFGAVAMKDDLIVIGGFTGTKTWDTVWVLDTTDKNAEWIEKPCMPFPRSAFSVAMINGEIFVCGGCDRDSIDKVFKDVQIFNGKDWRNGPNLGTPLKKAAVTVIPKSLLNQLL